MVLIGLISGPSAGPVAQPDEIPGSFSFELQDQFGKWHSTERLEAEVMVLVGGDRSARDATRSWAIKVNDLLGTAPAIDCAIAVFRLADLRGVPKGFRPLVARQLRKAYDTSILMDWDGQLTGRFEFTPRRANIAVIDRAGKVMLHLSASQPQPDDVDALTRALEIPALGAEGGCVDGYLSYPIGSSL